MHDRERFPLDDRLNALEFRLREWQPAPGGLDRDRMIFEAGRAASRQARPAPWRRFVWPSAAALAACLTLAMGLAWRAERTRREVLEVLLLAQQATPPGGGSREQPPAVARTEVPPTPEERPSSYLSLIHRLDAANYAVERIRPVSEEVDLSPPSRESRSAREPTPLRPRDFDRLVTL